MSMLTRKLVGVVALVPALCALPLQNAEAGSASGQLMVGITIVHTCHISTSDHAMDGHLDSIVTGCDKDTGYTVEAQTVQLPQITTGQGQDGIRMFTVDF